MNSALSVHVDMHVWVGDPGDMDDMLVPAGAGINEEQVAESAPMVRALVTRRLEQIWRTCEPHIEVPVGDDGHPLYKADPRFIEAGIRVIDRLARLYRLDSPQPGLNEPATASLEGLREQVREQVKALEARMGAQ